MLRNCARGCEVYSSSGADILEGVFAMTASSTAPGLVEVSRTNGVVANDHVQIPMSQQSALGSHGYDMHPQEFVRLSGCQEPGVRERLAAELHH
jgi:hypothetical protein